MDFDAIRQSLPSYASGAWMTFELTVGALAGGMLFALPLSILRGWPSRWVSGPVWGFTYVVRGTPLLVQLYLIYYGLGQFEAVRHSWAWHWLSSASFCAIAAFTINTCAYTIEILHGAMRAVPGGEIEAAKAMGMSRWVMLRRVVLPAAFRRMLPAYGNEVIFMLQATSLASTVTLMDLTGAAGEMNSRFYLPFEAFLTAAVIYLAITMALVGLFHFAERRWLMPWQFRRSLT
jgi:arginine/ornithine transport system permease protein